MKANLILSFLIIIGCSNLQHATTPRVEKLDADSLINYSYLLFGRYQDHGKHLVEKGTAFFVRTKHSLFLVSAYHAFTAWQPEVFARKDPYPDYLSIRLFRKDNNDIGFDTIDIRPLKAIKDSFHFYNKPDLYFYKIKIPEKYKIYSLEHFILNYRPPAVDPDQVINYGFPIEKEKVFDTTRTAKLLIGYLTAKLNNKYSWLNEENIPDSLNFGAMFAGPQTIYGRSGSPIFFRSASEITFGGMQIGANLENNQILMLRPEIIRDSLLQRIKEGY